MAVAAASGVVGLLTLLCFESVEVVVFLLFLFFFSLLLLIFDVFGLEKLLETRGIDFTIVVVVLTCFSVFVDSLKKLYTAWDRANGHKFRWVSSGQ